MLCMPAVFLFIAIDLSSVPVHFSIKNVHLEDKQTRNHQTVHSVQSNEMTSFTAVFWEDHLMQMLHVWFCPLPLESYGHYFPCLPLLRRHIFATQMFLGCFRSSDASLLRGNIVPRDQSPV